LNLNDFSRLTFFIPQEKVVGFHILSPNAGEITQGFGIGIKMGATKADFDQLIGIHPTIAEVRYPFDNSQKILK